MNIKQELIRLRSKLVRKEPDLRETNVKVVKEFTEEEKQMIENVDAIKEETVTPAAQVLSDHFANIRNISLDAKVDDYIKWNFDNMVKGIYTDIGEHWVPIELRNLIEKIAVWYELRYPDYEINRLMHCTGQESTKVSDVMFNRNNYINNLLEENSDVRALDWDEFYNAEAFFKSLPWEESYRFQNESYSKLVYLNPNYTSINPMEYERQRAHLHLNSEGFVTIAEGIYAYSEGKINNEELKGKHIKEVVELLKEKEIHLPEDNELEATIRNVENWRKQKEGLLDAVMYRIIERGGARIGPRRGFLFAKEFERNIDIPMMYGVDYSDPGLRLFINEYIKAGGSKELMCYVGYFSPTNKSKRLNTVSIHNLILRHGNNAATFYTPEETELHQRLVNVLANYAEENGSNTKHKQKIFERKIGTGKIVKDKQ